jgi:bacteriocin-like protein
MNFVKTLSRNEMKNISGGVEFTDEYGCTYSSSTAGCQSYYNCLTGVCTSTVLEDGWGAADCVEQVQTLSLSC